MKRSPNSAPPRIGTIAQFEPATKNQKRAEDSWKSGKHLILAGSPGTGKTYMALHFALQEVMKKNSEHERLIIFRSVVPTREIGFLPGDENEKKQAYASPYYSLLDQITQRPEAWGALSSQKKLSFETTSFVRGLTLDNAIVVVDEMQNLNFHELDSIITRTGVNTRLIFCGDTKQSDFTKDADRRGMGRFIEIVKLMQAFDIVTFGWEDIIRSDFVRDYIITKEMKNET